jgi:hypothetical protein
MSDWQLRTPVAFFIFKRPDTTKQVFEAIRQAKPSKLFLIADGPRPDRPGEAELCEATRAVVKNIDWDCEVFTNFSDVNLGCGKRPASGISWVFEQVEEAIILEDDCLPHPTFFRYCQEMLERYRDDERVASIAGSNFQFGYRRTNDSYYFSRHCICWGWATWKRAWKHFDFEMAHWPEIRDSGILLNILQDPVEVKHIIKEFQATYEGKTQAWDYQWQLACWLQSGMSITPNTNLVSNIGCGPDATHTFDQTDCRANLPSRAMNFPLKHPECILVDYISDRVARQKMQEKSYIGSFGSLPKRITRKLKKMFQSTLLPSH